MSSRDFVSHVDVRAWLHGISLGYLKAAIGLGVACACSACIEPSAFEGTELDSAQQALAQAGAPAPAPASCPPWKRGCRRSVCGNGVVENGEACDDGNQTAGDGCSATCQQDDDTRTPGDDRAGYVSCESSASGDSLTCGPGLGCCPDPTNVPQGPTCGATRTDCGFVMAFIVYCDGPEDCSGGAACSVTRTGQICGDGYYQVCHTDKNCPSGQTCNENGECRAPVSGP